MTIYYKIRLKRLPKDVGKGRPYKWIARTTLVALAYISVLETSCPTGHVYPVLATKHFEALVIRKFGYVIPRHHASTFMRFVYDTSHNQLIRCYDYDTVCLNCRRLYLGKEGPTLT